MRLLQHLPHDGVGVGIAVSPLGDISARLTPGKPSTRLVIPGTESAVQSRSRHWPAWATRDSGAS